MLFAGEWDYKAAAQMIYFMTDVVIHSGQKDEVYVRFEAVSAI